MWNAASPSRDDYGVQPGRVVECAPESASGGRAPPIAVHQQTTDNSATGPYASPMRFFLAASLLCVLLVPFARAAEAAPCVFCEIIAGKRQQEGIVYRDDQVV